MRINFLNYDHLKKQLKFTLDGDGSKKDNQLEAELRYALRVRMPEYVDMVLHFDKKTKIFTIKQCQPLTFLLESRKIFLEAKVKNIEDFENAVRREYILQRVSDQLLQFKLGHPATPGDVKNLVEKYAESPAEMNDIPADMWRDFVSVFMPLRNRAPIAHLNKYVGQALEPSDRDLLKIYFPHVLEGLEKSMPPDEKSEMKSVGDITVTPDYKKAFLEARDHEYKHMSERQKLIMNLFKEGDLEGIKNLQPEIAVADLYQRENEAEDRFYIPLYWARRNRDTAVLDYCYEKMTSAYRTSDGSLDQKKQLKPDGLTVLHWAIMCGKNLDYIKRLVNNERADFFSLPLAAREGRLDIVIYLASVVGRAPLGAALVTAARYGHTKIVEYFCNDSEFDIDQTAINRAFLAAALCGHLDVIKLIYEQGAADVNTQRNHAVNNVTALMLAAENGRLDIVKYLCAQEDTSINATTRLGATALYKAAQAGHLDIVKYFCEHQGVCINQKLKTNPIYLNDEKDMMALLDKTPVVTHLCAQLEVLLKHFTHTWVVHKKAIKIVKDSVSQWIDNNKNPSADNVFKPLIAYFNNEKQQRWWKRNLSDNDFLLANMMIVQSEKPSSCHMHIQYFLDQPVVSDAFKAVMRQVLDNMLAPQKEEKHQPKGPNA